MSAPALTPAKNERKRKAAAADVDGDGDNAQPAGILDSHSSTSSASKVAKVARPKTMTDKVVHAIRALKSCSGSSAQAILKYCATHFEVSNAAALKKAIKNAVASGVLEQNKASYLVNGDPAYEDTSETVTIVELSAKSANASAASSDDRVVQAGDVCTIAYTGTLTDAKGYKFDSAKEFSFVVGAGEVVKGMDRGVLGMSVGGRREVTIPASLGYGKRGSAPDIPPNATLCFRIELKQLHCA